MPELPEVETVARTLSPFLVGKRIESFDLYWPRTLANSTADEFRGHVVGRTITAVLRRAKLVVMELDSDDIVTIHLRMTGELLFRQDAMHSRDPNREPYLRGRFGLGDSAELLFYDTRKFGRITLIPSHDRELLDTMYGIEPLSESFTVDALADLLSLRSRQIKPLLLDQQTIAGLGNIYVDEALFRAGVHPLTPSNTIDPAQVTALHDAIVEVLSIALERRGTTFRDYRSGLGRPGENQAALLVYGKKEGTPCPQCGQGLRRIVVGQRGTVYCPECQPLMSSGRTPSR